MDEIARHRAARDQSRSRSAARPPRCSAGRDDGGQGRSRPAAERLRQNATLALAGVPNGKHQQRQRADQQDRLHLVFKAEHAESQRRAPSERARDAGAAPGHDQDHQREDDRAGRDQLAAQDPRVHGDAAGERECQRCDHRDAPVAHDQHATRPAKISTKPVAISQARTRPARTALVMAASNAGALAAEGMDDSDQASSRPSPCSS